MRLKQKKVTFRERKCKKVEKLQNLLILEWESSVEMKPVFDEKNPEPSLALEDELRLSST